MKNFIIILAFIAFWFEGNALHWTTNQQYLERDSNREECNFLQFQLDKKMPPTINQEPITQISISKKMVRVWAGEFFWNLHYSNDIEGRDWYVTGPYGPDGKL